MTILLAMMARKGHEIAAEDVSVAVLSQGADETRKELVRLMADCYQYDLEYEPEDESAWFNFAWVIEELDKTHGSKVHVHS